MKTRVIILFGVLLGALSCNGQEWIGNRFSLDTIVNLRGAHYPENTNLIKCTMHHNSFCFVEQQGFQYKESGYQAVIHTLSIDNYDQTEIILPLPECVHNKDRYAKSLWIYDFSFDGDYLLVTTQDELILYKRINNQNYRVESTYRHHNLYMGYLHQNKINFFEEDHDKGFKWFQQGLGGDSATLVRELPYEAPHIVQIQPNRYIFHNHQSVFFLSTRHPRLEIYSLDGRLLDTIGFDLSPWKAFEDDYIRKSLEIPYGIERIYAVKDDLSSYSYPKAVMPLGGDLLLLYTQIDSTTGNSVLQYAIRTEDGLTTKYLRNFHEDSIFHAALFPFNLFLGGLDKGNASDGDRIVQITYQTDVSWTGKTTQEYNREVNQHLTEADPILAFKVMRYIPEDKDTEPCLYSVRGQPIPLENLPSGKDILILHQGLECSGCVNSIYRLLDESVFKGIHIGNVYPHSLEGIAAYELRNQIQRQLSKPFSLYYSISPYYKCLSPTLSLQERDFPCLILFKKGEKPTVFRVSELFTSDFGSTEFDMEFLDRWSAFLSP